MLRVALCALALAACQKRDPLFCGSHPGDPRCLDDAGVADAPPDAPPGFETIGGTVLDNLAGTGLVLEDNATDDLMIGSAGSFQFATPLEMGTPYQVTVSSQPITPSQSCEVTNGSGTANADVSDVTVSCTTNKFVVSGAVYGLNNDQSVVLQLNGGNDIMIDGNGSAGGQSFAFTSAPLASGTTFGVAIGTQPAEQTCSISGGSGMVGDGDITTVVVDCATNSYILSGNITGLDGTVTVTDGTDSVSPAANGSFAFPPLLAGTSYTVVVTTQPTYPPLAQTCTVTNGGPSTLTTNVSNVMVACSTNTYTIGGNVAQLSGTVVLQDNGTDDKSVTASGGFTFATPLASGMTYAVTVHTQPASQYCTPTSASGTVTNNPITSVAVTCDSGIKCGSNECNPATGYTCCDPEGSHTSCTKSFCQQLDLPCDSAADCAARGTPGICCASTYRGAVDSVSCSSSCSGGSRTILCDPNLPGACASGTCTAYSALPGYYACQ